MFPFKSGMVFPITFLVLSLIMYYYCMNLSKKKTPYIRNLPGLDAIEECVKRAVEMNKPIYFSTGVGDITGGDMSQTLAGISLLGYTAKLAANLGAPLTYLATRTTIVPIAEDIIRTAYGDAYRVEQILFIPDQNSLMSMVIGEFQRTKPAANFLLGALYWETCILAEAGANVGAMQVGGTGRLYQVPYCVAMCDYSLISEEVMAAGAYISKEPSQLGTILGSDILRYVIVALAILIAITGAMGNDITGIFTM